jgi:hypothetical protein
VGAAGVEASAAAGCSVAAWLVQALPWCQLPTSLVAPGNCYPRAGGSPRRPGWHGVAVLLAFDCLLRASELTGLRREDVLDSAATDARVSEQRGVLLALRHTKTGSYKSVLVLDRSVIALLRVVVAATSPGALLFLFSTGSFRRAIRRACAQPGLSSEYVPHSLRHGGATLLHAAWHEHGSCHGRWASSKFAYIQQGPAMLMAMDVPAGVAAAAALAGHPLHLSLWSVACRRLCRHCLLLLLVLRRCVVAVVAKRRNTITLLLLRDIVVWCVHCTNPRPRAWLSTRHGS